MKFFSKILFFTIVAAAGGTLSSCNTSKIAYGNDYYFKAKPKTAVNHNYAEPVPEADELKVANTLEAETPHPVPAFDEKVVAERIQKAKQDLENQVSSQKQSTANEEVAEIAESKFAKPMTRLDRAERRQHRREIKSAMKSYKKAPQATEQEAGVSRNTRAGIILGAAGVVLILLGGGILYTIGAVLLVVGVVLILLDIL